MTNVRVLLCTCPPDAVQRIAIALLERRLAACVNALPGVVSRYWWRDRLETGEETLLLVKTTAAKVDGVIAAVGELHPYDVPEVLALPVEAGAQPYVDWVNDATSG